MAIKRPDIDLGVDQAKRLERRLIRMIQEAEEWRTSYWDDLHEMYWQLYLARPEQEIKNYPWQDASNLFIPQIQITVDGVIAQEYDAMFANEPFIEVKAHKTGGTDDAFLLSQYYNYFFKEVVNLRQIANDVLLNTAVDGTAVMKPRFNRDYRVVRDHLVTPRFKTERQKGILFGSGVEIQGPEMPIGIEYSKEEIAIVEPINEVAVDVGDLGHIYVAPGSGATLQWPDCRWYYQKQILTWEDMVQRQRMGYQNIDDELRNMAQAENVQPKEKVVDRQEGVTETGIVPTFEVYEFYMRWPLAAEYLDEKGDKFTQDGEVGDYEEEVIVTYLPKFHRLLRVIPLHRVYPDGKRPHVDIRFMRRGNFFYGMGIPSRMRHINAAMNTAWNQMIDYGHLQNLPWGLYQPSGGAPADIIGIRPGTLNPALDPGSVNFPRFQGDPNFWIMVNQQLQVIAEKVGLVNDYTLGRAPTTPNAPRTYRGQAMMNQSNQMNFGRIVAMHAEAFVEVARRVHALKRRFARPETIFRVLNKQTGLFEQKSLTAQELNQDVDFSFVLNPNRVAEQQLKLQVVQTMTPVLMQVNPMGLRPLYKGWFQSLGERNFDEIWPEQMAPQIQTQPPIPAAEPEKEEEESIEIPEADTLDAGSGSDDSEPTGE